MRVWMLFGVFLCAGAGLAASQSSGKQVVKVGPDRGLPFSPAVVAGDFIYVAGHLGRDATGQLAAGDVKAQTRQTLDNIAAVLKAAGADLSRAAAVTVYLRNASDFQAMNEVYRTCWPADPPARTTVVAGLVAPEALVEISMIAIRPGAERTVIHPEGWARSPNPYSYGIKSGDTLFLAGLVSRNNRTDTVVEGDIKTQVKAALDSAGEILAAAGMNHAHLVSSRVYITDTALFQDMNAAYREYFPEKPPARATVVTGLMGPQYAVEITTVAVNAPKEAIVTPAADGSPGRPNPVLSSAIRVGNRLYLSGMLGVTPETQGDPKAQTAATLARIGRTLKAAGFDWPHIVDGLVYLTDMQDYAAMNEAYRAVLSKDFPARATVGTGLVSPTGLVEIMFTAHR